MAKNEKVTKNPKFKVKHKVSGVPFLIIEEHVPVYVQLTSVITAGMMKKKAAHFVNVTNLETGELQKLMLGAVLVRQLLESYPNEAYVNKKFEIIRGEKVKGQENSYHEYEISELED